MKIQKFIFLMLGIVLAACTPRVDDIFDNTSVVRLEHRREALMKQFIEAPDGWVMQYFARVDPTSSDTMQHRGYTFLMQFREDGTVTVGAIVNGVYKTETSMWDIVNDNSSVLTFNTYNSIFHYCSNPDPEGVLFGTGLGEGVGGDYEFMVLEYNEQQDYQLLKGKKQGCYIRMYPLKAGQDWEDYLAQIAAMDEFLLAEDVPWDLYQDDLHWTLYNVRSHEFRTFTFGEDTLGGGSYYGYITTPVGIYMNGGVFDLVVQHYQYDEQGNKIGEEVRDTVINIPRDAFVLNAERTRMIAVDQSDTYITIDGKTAFVADANKARPWNIDVDALPASVVDARTAVNAAIAAVEPNSYVTKMRWDGAGKNRMALRIYYVVGGDAGNSYDIYYFNKTETNETITLTADDTYSSGSILHQFGGLDLVHTFDGTYSIELLYGFRPSKGLKMQKSGEEAFQLNLTH